MARRRPSNAFSHSEHDHNPNTPANSSQSLRYLHHQHHNPNSSAAMSAAALSATLATQLSRFSSPNKVTDSSSNPSYYYHQRGDSSTSLPAFMGLTGLGNIGTGPTADPGLAYLTSTPNASILDHQPAADPHRVIRQMVRLCHHIYSRAFVDGACSDVTVSVPGWNKTYHLHRLVLYQNSYFSSLLEGGFRESTTPDSVTLHFDASNSYFTPEAFEVALGRLYGRLDEPVLHGGNVLQLLATCSFLDVQDVCELCVEFVLRNLREQNVIEFLRFADSHVVNGSDRILEAVFTFLCREGWRKLKDQFVRLPAEWLKRVLEHDAFWVPSEYERYRFAKDVITKRRRLAHERTLQELRLQAQLQHLPPQPPPPQPQTQNQPQQPQPQPSVSIQSEPPQTQPEYPAPEEADLSADSPFAGSPPVIISPNTSISMITPQPSTSTPMSNEYNARRPVVNLGPQSLHTSTSSSVSPSASTSASASASARRFSAFSNASTASASPFGVPGNTSGMSVPTYLSSTSLQQSYQHDEHAYRLILAQSIYYIHMSFEELTLIRRDRDPLTGRSLVADHVLKDALWQQVELRAKIEAANEDDVYLGTTTTAVGTVAGDDESAEELLPADDPRSAHSGTRAWSAAVRRASTVSTASHTGIAGLPSSAGQPSSSSPPSSITSPTSSPAPIALARTATANDGRVLHTIPTDDTTHIGESGLASVSMSAVAAAAAAATPAGARRERGRARQSFATFTYADSEDGEAAEEVEVGGMAVGRGVAGVGVGPRVEYSVFAPFRFGVEFVGVQNLKEKCRIYSETVFYAGSNWNMYIQKIKTPRKGVQLGVYLHRYSMPVIGNRHGAGAEDEPGKNVVEPSAPSFSRYADRRKTVRTWFKIFCPSRGPSHNLTVFQSSPDNFTLMQSWGWRSTSLCSDEYLVDQLPVSTDGSPSAPGASAGATLRFSVVMGHV
ncbi:hypothetical protein BC936DRAFT_149839 [Jimgerdemannia flammicorona]|uniref:Uncharacterized protein n=2 Tax=Jimgerdemannia flammicorona TaxID=994334 RepID=A0A433QJU0_9FUNG|nr:hypothetical protein BC936DRAFT_149839 [Jimgerdemannia flammicorona]RUS30035.1 hypothetical protein BC938DRAFT_479922 [Jimgerdemannia flammicorona]